MDLPSRLDLFQIAANHIATRAKRIDPGEPFVDGSDANIYAGTSSVLAASVVRQIAYKSRIHYLDGAFGEDLDRHVWDRYRMTRKGASAAIGGVRFYRPDATFGTGTVPMGTRLGTLGNTEYITTTTAVFSASSLEAFADVRAVQAGKGSQVGANQIRRISRPETIFDTSLKVNNDKPTAGGEPAELDEDLRGRARRFWEAARRGVLGAIEFGALAVAGVASAQAIEAIAEGNRPARVVSLSIADSSGVASDALARLVRTSLLEYRAGGITVLVYSGLPQLAAITLLLSFQAGVDTVALTEIVRGAVIAHVNSLAVNEALQVSGIMETLRFFKESGLIVDDKSIVAPVGDLVPGPGFTIRTTQDLVTVL